MHKGTTLASLARLIVPFTEPAHRPKVILVGRPDYQISRADKKQYVLQLDLADVLVHYIHILSSSHLCHLKLALMKLGATGTPTWRRLDRNLVPVKDIAHSFIHPLTTRKRLEMRQSTSVTACCWHLFSEIPIMYY